MSEPILGQIMIFAGNFAPRGWATCDGQLMAIAQNTALFSILGTTYGGNGQTTFALPDLRGRVPLHPGQGPGLSPHEQGENAGQETSTLTVNELPAHTHSVSPPASNGVQSTNRPGGAVPARGGAYRDSANTTMTPATSAPSGGGQPHNNMQPYLGINYIIALEGIYPSRN